MLTTPVVLVAFNRPHLTARTFATVREARPAELFLIADGPRADHPADVGLCAETRAVLQGVDWPCEVHRRYAVTNLGLEANVELGLDWVFSLADRAIVLEDDCLPHPTLFPFLTELLERYADDQRVWQLSGSAFGIPEAPFEGDSYAFTAWASVWGWATWADRWQQHRALFPRDHVARGEIRADAPLRTHPFSVAPGRLVTRSASRHFAEAAASDDTVTHGWDKHWWLSMMTADAYAVTPSVTMVQNVGWGADATHGTSAGRTDPEALGIAFPLRHPATVALNVEVERELELVLSRVGGRLARVARRLVTSPSLRRVLRRTADSRAATRTARAVSRLIDRSPRG